MSIFNEPKLMRRYADGTIRIVCHKEISVGETIEYKNERWLSESVMVTEIIESRPSLGDFGGNPVPNSYRLQTV